jgi:hypothetical protein
VAVAVAAMVFQLDSVRRVCKQRMACFSVFLALPSATLRTMATAPCQVMLALRERHKACGLLSQLLCNLLACHVEVVLPCNDQHLAYDLHCSSKSCWLLHTLWSSRDLVLGVRHCYVPLAGERSACGMP